MSLLHRIAFASLKGMTLRLARELLARVGDEVVFFESTESRLAAITGTHSKLFDAAYRKLVLDNAREEVGFVESNRVTPTYFTDNEYPQRLTECDDAPLMLYSLGQCNLNSTHVIGIVGTRHATPYGIDFTQRLVSDLASKLDDIVIVSGLAYGIDVTAHRAALHSQVPTVAVLAHGLNTLYPPAHRSTAAEMARSGGMLLTEYKSHDKMHKGNFVARNRIVAGLCDCIVVAESAAKGGALITANLAAGYHRDVMALPGRTSDRYSQGCNSLIARNVAALIDGADSLIETMQWTSRQQEGEQAELPIMLNELEQAVVDYLTVNGEGIINQMCVKLNIPINKLMTTLVDLEFNGLILTYPGGKYRLA